MGSSLHRRAYSQKVCQFFCLNGPVHDAILSRAGIRSGHRIVKWFKASRQWWMGIVHFFAACRSARNSNFNAASWLGNPPRVLMILRSDRFSDSTLLVV